MPNSTSRMNPWGKLNFNFIGVVLFGLSLFASMSLAVQTNSEMSEPTVVLVLGDSLSAAYGIDTENGWVTLLQEKIDTRNIDAKVINISVSGETTEGGVSRINNAIKKFSPDIVLVELGGNDGLRGLPLTRTKHNLLQIVTRIQQADAEVLLFEMRLPTNLGRAFSQRFQAIFSEVGAEMNIKMVPFFLHNVAGRRAYMQTDGIHPSAIAQPLMLENVWPWLVPIIQEKQTKRAIIGN